MKNLKFSVRCGDIVVVLVFREAIFYFLLNITRKTKHELLG